MTKVEYQTQINVPVQRVYEYYTNPNNIQETWTRDIVKESEDVSGSKNEGSEMRVKGQYMGKEEEMRLQVVDKEQNKRLVTKQTQGPFKNWSIQEFQGNGTNTIHIEHTIDFELPTTGKIANTLLSGIQADNKIKKALEQVAQTVKQKLESGAI